MADAWNKPYSREYAAFPAAWLRGAKFWPTTGTWLPSSHLFDEHQENKLWPVFAVVYLTGRVDNVYGDRKLICTLLPVSQMAEEAAAATA